MHTGTNFFRPPRTPLGIPLLGGGAMWGSFLAVALAMSMPQATEHLVGTKIPEVLPSTPVRGGDLHLHVPHTCTNYPMR